MDSLVATCGAAVARLQAGAIRATGSGRYRAGRSSRRVVGSVGSDVWLPKCVPDAAGWVAAAVWCGRPPRPRIRMASLRGGTLLAMAFW